MQFNTCRLCKNTRVNDTLLRYGIRHYCHAECGFDRWGDEFLRKIPNFEIGCIPYRLLQTPNRKKLAVELCPEHIRPAIKQLTILETRK